MPDEPNMPVDVHGLIAQSFSKEYVEAVVTDALKILPAYNRVDYAADQLLLVWP
jgi:hypothetical protein